MPHHLNHHHPLVRAGRAVQPVDGIRSNTDGRIESEGKIGSPNVIVYCFWHGYDVQPHSGEFGGCLLRTVSTDADHTIKSHLFDIPHYQCRFVHVGHHAVLLKGLLARSTEHRTSQVQQTG